MINQRRLGCFFAGFVFTFYPQKKSPYVYVEFLACDARYPPTKSHLFKILHRLIGVDQAQARRKAAAGEPLTTPGGAGMAGANDHHF